MQPEVAKTTVAADEGETAGKKTSNPVATAAPAAAPKNQVVTIALGVNGTFAQLQAFISAFTSIDRYVQINQIDVTSAQSSSSSSIGATTDQVSATIQASAYFFPAK